MSPQLHLCVQLPRVDFSLDVDVRLPAHGITAVYGVSGSGKTSLLRAVAGLEPQARGRVDLAGQVWQDDAQGIRLPTHQRPVGYVFQEASLFDHLDVQGNLSFGLRRSAGQPHTLDAAIALLGIGGLLQRRVQQLSGGERQRVAIARALATQPALLLLDEPLAALDAARRQDILPWLEKLRDELQLPMLYVTHAMDEVARLADTMLLMQQGRVQAVGPVSDVLAGSDAALMLGDDVGALLDAHVQALDITWHLAQVGFDGGAMWLRDTGLVLGQRVRLRVLARDVSINVQAATGTSIQNHVPGVVQSLTPDLHPSQVLVRVACGPSVLVARVTARAVHELGLTAGQTVWAQVKSVALVK
ncbi:molybdenum ABC transporter ATP-binding protein [Limnohabitans sp. JirII-31]|uniref:molybdenum ABC transporter ATP-binding protein n=1 Tax=Limnohabitans sp. JirII-31 TaxID=1977908 RepID=UPI000C1E5DD1|nr:molybdenum ABC transporter ATP-binding protein [Limnohabitans sp. JirII-31]PIT73543.1 molybdenum ABC transporter ATP-binding protein [Limnohabitans sp. JirII-31]